MAMSGGAGHIIVCGERVPCGARVVTWEDQGGLSAYAPRRRSPDGGAPAPVTDSARTFGVRRDEGGREIAQLRAGAGVGPEARAALRARVHQLVAHYDGCGTARRCFRVLHDERGLSAHFIIDLDGALVFVCGGAHAGMIASDCARARAFAQQTHVACALV